MVEEDEMVCVDVETTGFDANKDEVIEVCAIIFNKAGQLKERFYRLCEPISGFIPEAASIVNKITIDKVRGCKPYSEVRQELAEFIGGRTVIGHNIIAFDSRFLKIEFKNMEDTLLMCRNKWPGGKNNLAAACVRVRVEFDKALAHGATYDVERTIRLYLTLKNLGDDEHIAKIQQTDMFEKKKPEEKKLEASQPYSFSRIDLFQQCPWKWYQVYILGKKQKSNALDVGSCVHIIAQLSAMWCYAKTFGSRFEQYASKSGMTINSETLSQMNVKINKGMFYMPKTIAEVTIADIGTYVYMNMSEAKAITGMNMSTLIDTVTKGVAIGEFAIFDKPAADIYEVIVQRAIAHTRIRDHEALADVRYVSEFFYKQKDFIIMDGAVSMVEKKMACDKNWNMVSDFFSPEVHFRGVMDIIEYNGPEMVTITDYKSGRKMLSEEELKEDRQLSVYILLIHLLIPGVNTIRIKHHYMRYGKVVETVVSNVSEVADAAKAWISASIEDIERALATGEAAFTPSRNKFCSSCNFCDDNTCPLFNVKNINDISKPADFVIKSPEDLAKAYKKIEVNKSEVKALTKKCKEYLETHHKTILIDDKAILDYWIKEGKEYDALAVAKLLTEKEVPLSNFLGYFSLPQKSWEGILKMLNKRGVSIDEKEIESVTTATKRTTFDAFTREEAEADGYINVTIDEPAKEEPESAAKA